MADDRIATMLDEVDRDAQRRLAPALHRDRFDRTCAIAASHEPTGRCLTISIGPSGLDLENVEAIVDYGIWSTSLACPST